MKRLLPSVLFLLLAGSAFGADSTFDFLLKTNGSYKDVLVQNVISGDTLVIESNLVRGEEIKLVGLDAPDAPPRDTARIKRNQYGFVVKDAPDPIKSLDELSRQLLEDLIKGKHVRLEFDTNKKDKDGKTIAYVFRIEDELFINAEVLREGMAALSIRPPNTKYADELRRAYLDARENKRGVHSE